MPAESSWSLRFHLCEEVRSTPRFCWLSSTRAHRISIRSTNRPHKGDSSQGSYKSLHGPHIPDTIFQILDSRFLISDLRVQFLYSRFQILDFRLRIADFTVQISALRFQVSDFTFQIPDFDATLVRPHSCGQDPLPSHTRSEYVALVTPAVTRSSCRRHRARVFRH